MRDQRRREEVTVRIAAALSWFLLLPGAAGIALILIHTVVDVSGHAVVRVLWVAIAAAGALCLFQLSPLRRRPSGLHQN